MPTVKVRCRRMSACRRFGVTLRSVTALSSKVHSFAKPKGRRATVKRSVGSAGLRHSRKTSQTAFVLPQTGPLFHRVFRNAAICCKIQTALDFVAPPSPCCQRKSVLLWVGAEFAAVWHSVAGTGCPLGGGGEPGNGNRTRARGDHPHDFPSF